MKSKTKLFSIIVLLLALVISENLFAQNKGVLYALNASAQTVSKMDLETKTITQNLFTTGSVPNRIYTYEGMLYVVNSTPENIMVVDPSNDQEYKTIIALNEGSNPWAMAFISATKAYVSNLNTDDVSVVDLTSGTVTKNISVGKSPEGILIVDNKAYVACTGYAGWGAPYEQSVVSVIDINTDEVVNTLNVPTNAQDIAIAPNGSLHVVCTGDYAAAFGAVAVIDISAETAAVTDTIVIGGSPGDIEIAANGSAYLSAWGDANNGFIYKYNANTNEVINNSDNPILVGPNLSGLFMDKEDNLWVPYMTAWGGDGFAQSFSVEADSVVWVSDVLGNGTSDFALLEAKYTGVEVSLNNNIPTEYSLSQNYPNPFNPTTTIKFQIEKKSNVSLKVYDILGNEVAELINDVKSAGTYNVKFNAENLASGFYFYSINAGEFTATKKMILIK